MTSIYDPLGIIWNWRADLEGWIGIVDGEKVLVDGSRHNERRLRSGETTRTYRQCRRARRHAA